MRNTHVINYELFEKQLYIIIVFHLQPLPLEIDHRAGTVLLTHKKHCVVKNAIMNSI